MAKNKLIAIGCSYTEHYEDSIYADESELNFIRWPQHLADKLDMECVNLGKASMGQEYMVAKLLDTLISEKNIGLIVIMWSEWQRLDFQFRPGKGTNGWVNLHPHRDNFEVERYPINREARIALLEHNNVISATMRSLRFFLMAQELIKDIPYLMIQGCNPLCDVLYLHPESDNVDWQIVAQMRNKSIKQIINSPISDRINENNFIGWPIFEDIGGYYLDNYLDEIDPERIKYRISENDSHPNGLGHEIISEEILYDKYMEIYK